MGADTEVYIRGAKGDIAALTKYIKDCVKPVNGKSLSEADFRFAMETINWVELQIPKSADKHKAAALTQVREYKFSKDHISLLMGSAERGGVWFWYALAYEFNCTPYCREEDYTSNLTDDKERVCFKETHRVSEYVGDMKYTRILKKSVVRDSRYEGWEVIPNISEWVQKRFKLDSYLAVRRYVENRCKKSYFRIFRVKYKDMYGDMRKQGQLMCRIKQLAAEHGIVITDLYKLRDFVWSMKSRRVAEVSKILAEAPDKHTVCQLLLEGALV